MQITIRFDKDSSKWVDKNFEFNRLFVKTQHEYIKDLSKHQGYIYLNTIYELLGLRWDPYDENICWIFERDGEPKFLLHRAILVEKFVLIFSQNIKIEPLTTALSFYPRLEFSTQVTEKHVKLISEKFPGLKIWKNILKGGRT